GTAGASPRAPSPTPQPSAPLGPAQSLPPQKARGEPADPRSAVSATGWVPYELLPGPPPFVGDNPVSVAYQHVREDPRPPSDLNREVSPDVDAIVLKALAKNRANRYQSAAEMRGDLLRAAAGRPVLATPAMRQGEQPPLPLRGRRPTGPMARVTASGRRASPSALVALPLLGLLAVAALGAGLYLAGRTPQSQVPELIGLTAPQAQTRLSQAKLNGSGKI